MFSFASEAFARESGAAIVLPQLQGVVAVSLLIIGAFNIILFSMRTKDLAPLWFGFFSMLLSVNVMVSSSAMLFLPDLLPPLPKNFFVKADYFTIMLAIPVFGQFLHTFFGIHDRFHLQKGLWWISALYLLLIIISPDRLTITIFRAFFPIIMGAIIYCAATAVLSVCNRREDAPWILAGIIVLSAAGVNDVLWGYGMVPTFIAVPAATVVFALVYSALLSRRFARAFAASERLVHELLENQRLRDAVAAGAHKEEELRRVQRRLTGLLHSIDEPLCAVDASGNVEFCNRAFEALTGRSLAQIEGTPLSESLHLGGDNAGKIVTIPLESDGGTLEVVLVRPAGYDAAKNSAAVAFLAVLNRNRMRIRSLEALLGRIHPGMLVRHPELEGELRAIDHALDQMELLLVENDDGHEPVRLGTVVMNRAIEYWTTCTAKSRQDLARESGLWKVYTNPDGWERTQTLDRYFDEKNFPKNPRWSSVFKTAEYVLEHCSSVSPLREDLEESLFRLQHFVSSR